MSLLDIRKQRSLYGYINILVISTHSVTDWRVLQNEENTRTIQQVRNMFLPECQWLPAVHVIDLEASGPIGAHVDTKEVRKTFS